MQPADPADPADPVAQLQALTQRIEALADRVPSPRRREPQPAPAAGAAVGRTLRAAGQERTGTCAGGSDDRPAEIAGAAHVSKATNRSASACWIANTPWAASPTSATACWPRPNCWTAACARSAAATAWRRSIASRCWPHSTSRTSCSSCATKMHARDRELSRTLGDLHRAPRRPVRRTSALTVRAASTAHESRPTTTDRRACKSLRIGLYSAHVLCCGRRRAQTFALSLNYDHGDATEARSAGPPCSGKPDGLQAFPLEPRVQGRFARIAIGGGRFHSQVAVTGSAGRRSHHDSADSALFLFPAQ